MNQDSAVGSAVHRSTGILLVNLGSPETPDASSVRRYLKDFLGDPRVVNLPRPLWWIILNLFVLPFRPARSARAYKKIWMENGSPLAVLSRRLCQGLAERIGGDFRVELAMRYGEPSIQRMLNVFRSEGVNRIVILPLYPQYSLTTTASVFDAVFKEIKTWPYIPEVRFINDYYRSPEYIRAIAESIRTFRTQHGKGQMLLISFHGLPEKSIEIGDPYFDQCRRTASSVAGMLGLGDNEWQMVFQSRFGAAEWLKPYCVDILRQLPERGIKRIDVVCPGFAVDCLETLEEIGIANKAVFLGAGGENYRYIPSLNDEPSHVDALVSTLFATD